MHDLLNNLANTQQSVEPIETPPLIQQNAEQQKLHFSERLFTVEKFKEQMRQRSHTKGLNYSKASNNIDAYSLAAQCIRIPFFRIKSVPLEDYSAMWLPIEFRGQFGTAAHDLIQDIYSFTETEVCLKVPSLQVSMRLDALIDDDILIEIKSCSYDDYSKVLSSKKAREADFLQAVFYKYLLENHLEELKQQPPSRNGSVAKLDNYNIKHIQIIYVCHELMSNNDTSINDDVRFAKDLRRKLDSKKNPFWFITHLDYNLEYMDLTPYQQYLLTKHKELKYSLDNNIVPSLDNPFIKKTSCFFCVYSRICNNY